MIAIIAPATLNQYVTHLQTGFLTPPIVKILNDDQRIEDFRSNIFREFDGLVQKEREDDILHINLQWHGAGHEQPIISLLPSLLKNFPECKISVLVHRPEEVLLRLMKDKQEMNNEESHPLNATEMETLLKEEFIILCGNNETSSNKVTFVLPGPSCLTSYAPLLPKHVKIKVIPHGFFNVGSIGAEERYNCDRIHVIGSRTTWGELRALSHLIELAAEINLQNDEMGGEANKYIFFASGNFQHVDEHEISVLRCNPKVWILDDGEIDANSSEFDPTSISSFKNWLYKTSKKRVIIRSTTQTTHLTGLPEIPAEKTIIDYNLQLYKEALSRLRSDSASLYKPKVEYSGTLHATGGPAISIVFKSEAMDDVSQEGGAFKMIEIPIDYKSGVIDFGMGAREVIEMGMNPDLRKTLISGNVEAAGRCGMGFVAAEYYKI